MIDISVIIVSYNVRCDLATCLLSLAEAQEGLQVETIVVDNASTDGSPDMVNNRFDWVKLIQLEDNVGFARANNIALEKANGRHLMLLNPDTIVRDDSLQVLVKFLDENPEYGAVGPKLLNEDGTFQPTAKRSQPTPWSSFTKLIGLSRLFPRSPVFNEYELGYLDENERHDVGALCGAAMVVRREAYEKAGGLDEDYFMFGEDIAWSEEILKDEWKIGYLPDAPIMHLKGRSTNQELKVRDKHFFEAMRIFYHKKIQANPIQMMILDTGVMLARAGTSIKRHKREIIQAVRDILLLSVLVWLLLPLIAAPEYEHNLIYFYGPILAILPVLMLSLLGMYREAESQDRAKPPFFFVAAVLFAFLAGVGYFLAGAEERIGLFMLIWAGFGWVLLSLPRLWSLVKNIGRSFSKSTVAGADDISRTWINAQHDTPDPTREAWTWVLWGKEEDTSAIETLGMPVIGRVEDLPALIRRGAVSTVLFSTGSATYTQILTFLELSPLKNVDIGILDECSLWELEREKETAA